MRSGPLGIGVWTWTSAEILYAAIVALLISTILWRPAQAATECTKRKYLITFSGTPINSTISCPMYFQWTVSDYCCYSKYDRYDHSPYCCYSDTYKLFVAVGLFCGVLIGGSVLLFFCWVYDVPHHLLYITTCGKFHLKNWLKRRIINGPYVDPTFYSGEPFWSRGAAEIQPYPLRPMPPRIFYPAAPTAVKFRWDGITTSNGQIPLFIVASRQFTRNPYSARPSDRVATAVSNSGPNSRRSSTITLTDTHSKFYPVLDFSIHMNEVEAATELLEALKRLEEKGEKPYRPPGIPEESYPVESESIEMARKVETDTTVQTETELDSVGKSENDYYATYAASGQEVATAADTYIALIQGNLDIPNPSDVTEQSLSASVLMLPSPPATPFSLDERMIKEINRVEIPYTSPKLPGSVPESTDET